MGLCGEIGAASMFLVTRYCLNINGQYVHCDILVFHYFHVYRPTLPNLLFKVRHKIW